jgi:DNA-binding NarL/FixJ family response regulator
MQISPLSPIPPLLRSGRADPTPRSDSATAPIRVLIGDGDGEFRRGLSARFAADPRVEVVGEADDGARALELVRRLHPDVALLDEDMPSFGGFAVARILKSELPEVRVVVMTRTVSRARR